MTRCLQLFFSAAALTGAAFAQTSDMGAPSSSPIAYVYVTTPTSINGFAASSTAKLTSVPGSPLATPSLSHLSVNRKFLFGPASNSQDIYTFSIGPKGSLKRSAVLNDQKYNPDQCAAMGPVQIDPQGATLYNQVNGCANNDGYIQSFRIESNGELQFLANAPFGIDLAGLVGPSHLYLLGNSRYGYQTGCNEEALSAETAAYKRESNGALVDASVTVQQPLGGNGTFYCPLFLAPDPANHLAYTLQGFDPTTGMPDGPPVLASYTADSHGNLTTTGSYENMPSSGIQYVSAMSLSESGKLLAVGGGYAGCDICGDNGFQIFHFNGSGPITSYTRVLEPGEQFIEFAWDSHEHLYALSNNYLHVYKAYTTSITEEPSSPYSIPGATSLIVARP